MDHFFHSVSGTTVRNMWCLEQKTVEHSGSIGPRGMVIVQIHSPIQTFCRYLLVARLGSPALFPHS